jgi:serine/threonine protein kinase
MGDGVVDEPTASDTPPGLRPGSRFGHYRLKGLLGWGGFGEVYEADDTIMDRAVALKLLAAPYSQSEVFRRRLYREARNAGKLHEPHVVPIHHCHGQAASDSATRTVDSLGGPANDEHVKTVKCCVKQKAQQGGVEN